MIKRLFEHKERMGRREPLQFLVLDELNKYAPREGWSPIKEVLLDIAERGRSLGIVLIGAQQTASRGRAPGHRQLRVPGRRPARHGRGAARRVRLPPGGHPRAGRDPQARLDVSSSSRRSRPRSRSGSRSRAGRRGPRRPPRPVGDPFAAFEAD